MIKAIDIARFFAEKGSGSPKTTNAKLEKLTFYAQSYYLGIYGVPLFEEAIIAGEHGPRVPSLHLYGDHGDGETSINNFSGAPIQDPKTLKFLNAVWNTYGGFGADLLRRMTLADPPWINARKLNEESPKITQESMRDHFSSRADDIDLEGGNALIKSIFGQEAVAIPSSID